MGNKLGNQELEFKTETPKKVESYRLITFSAPELPEEFKHLIIAPFLNSLRYGNDLFKLIDQDAYYDSYKKYIEHLLSRPTATVKLAMLDDDTVLGWSLTQGKIVHYVWVKKESRRLGIGRALLPKDFDTITHITNKGMNIWVNKFPQVRLNPFI